MRPEGTPAGAAGGQGFLRRAVNPGRHVLERGAPGQDRRRAQGQHRRQRVPDPRGSRGSGTIAKHSSRFPPDAAPSARQPGRPAPRALLRRRRTRACDTGQATGLPGRKAI
jgi:hypothetical protein